MYECSISIFLGWIYLNYRNIFLFWVVNHLINSFALDGVEGRVRHLPTKTVFLSDNPQSCQATVLLNLVTGVLTSMCKRKAPAIQDRPLSGLELPFACHCLTCSVSSFTSITVSQKELTASVCRPEDTATLPKIGRPPQHATAYPQGNPYSGK